MAGKRPKGSPERIGRLLHATAGSALAVRLKDLAIWQEWERAVGPAIAARTRPLRISGGVLTILVASGPWMQQLSFMKAELCARINGQLGEERVREIVLKSGKIQQESEREQEPRRAAPPPLSSQQQQWISSHVAEVKDREVALSLQQLMEAHYRHLKTPS
ncbi:MAG: DUF721 domain-containing protein [Geobacter sp.]|nr:DUF721 domain-containing protein [Geobacter sp.]